MANFSYDIIIVGGGMVGLTVACALAQQTTLSIAVLEAQAMASDESLTDYHARVSAISLASVRIFQVLNIWDEIKALRVSPFTHIEARERDTEKQITFSASEAAQPYLGYIIENPLIQRTLQKKIKTYPQVTVISPIKLLAMNSSETEMELISEDKGNFRAKLVIAADGANSWVRKAAGIEMTVDDYQQQALVATVQTEKSHERRARQVFLNSAVLAFLPLAEENLCSIVWSLDKAEAAETFALDDETFLATLAQHFPHLGKLEKTSKRYAFPLTRRRATTYVQDRLALVGDAAHVVHPLAGQGVNMGLLDAMSLAEIIETGLVQGRDYARLYHLRQYERWRKADNLGLLVGVDTIKKIFSSHKKISQWARAVGLDFVNEIQTIKSIFLAHAIGQRTNLPKRLQSFTSP